MASHANVITWSASDRARIITSVLPAKAREVEQAAHDPCSLDQQGLQSSTLSRHRITDGDRDLGAHETDETIADVEEELLSRFAHCPRAYARRCGPCSQHHRFGARWSAVI